MRTLTYLLAASLCVVAPIAAQNSEIEVLRKKADAAVQAQNWGEAAAAYAQLTKAAPKDGQAWHMLGYSLHAQGKLDSALEAHIKAAEFPAVAATATYNIACVYALKGESDKAMAWLGKAAEAGFSNGSQLDGDPDMDSLRDDPRFKKFRDSMAGGAAKGKMQVFDGATSRVSRRVMFWQGNGSPGQVVLGFAQPVWQDKFSEAITSSDYVGQRVRLGKDFWTTLDTNIDLEFGDVEVPAGYYYLALQSTGEKEFALVLMDPAKVRAKKLDAFQTKDTVGGITVPLKYAETAEASDKLDLGIKMAEGGAYGKFWIAFGPHAVTSKVVMKVKGY